MKGQSNSFVQLALKNIATIGFVGYAPIAPGTFGSLAGLLLYLIIRNTSWAIYLSITLLLFIIGISAAEDAEEIFKQKDSRHIVIDELVGFLVAAFLIPDKALYIAAAFIVFRLFDIIKPFPARWIDERIEGGLGVMGDDIIAGIYANLLLQIWRFTAGAG